MKTLGFVLLASLAAVAAPHDADLADLRGRLDGAAAQMAAGDPDAAALDCVRAFQAFENMGFHGALAAKDNNLYKKLESDWLDLVKAYETNDGAAAAARRDVLADDFAVAEKLFAEPPSGREVAVNAFVILFREGFEALLILGAIAAMLRKIGRRELNRVLWAGAGSAVIATAGLYLLSIRVLRISGKGQEILEGATMLIAAAVLFWMSYWLISKVQGRKWQSFIHENVQKALSGGNTLGFGALAFLVVFREGFETVLMLRALQAGAVGWGPVVSGVVAASVGLAIVFYAVIIAGLRMPIRAFFGATSAVMLVLVFKFAGDGITELQEGRVMPRHPVSWIPDSTVLANWLGIHPTAESLLMQSAVILLIVAGLALTFLRRSPPAAVDAPEPAKQPVEAVR